MIAFQNLEISKIVFVSRFFFFLFFQYHIRKIIFLSHSQKTVFQINLTRVSFLTFSKRGRDGVWGTDELADAEIELIDCMECTDIDTVRFYTFSSVTLEVSGISWRLTWPKWVPAPCAHEGIAASWKNMLRAVCNRESTWSLNVPDQCTKRFIAQYTAPLLLRNESKFANFYIFK